MPRQRDPNEKVKYLIQRSRGNFIIEIPSTYKVTFGYVNPKSDSRYGGGAQGMHCVRVWDGEKLRAVFGDCTGLRDMSIPYAVEVRSETGSSTWKKDSEGNFEESTKVSVEKTLVLEAPIVERDEDDPPW